MSSILRNHVNLLEMSCLAVTVMMLTADTAFGADGIALEVPNTHALVARISAPETVEKNCAGPPESRRPRVQIFLPRVGSPGDEPIRTASAVNAKSDEINSRIDAVSLILSRYPNPKQLARVRPYTRETVLKGADKRIRQQLAEQGAVIFVGVDPARLNPTTTAMYKRLGVITDLSKAGACQVQNSQQTLAGPSASSLP